MNLFDITINRKGTYTKKWDDIYEIFGVSPNGILPFWIADMDFKTSEAICTALAEECEFGVFGYPDKLKRCRNALEKWLMHRHNWDISHYQVSFFPRIMGGMALAIDCFTRPGDRIVVQPPIYPPFMKMVKLAGRTVISNPLVMSDGKYRIDFDDLEKKFSDGAKFLMFCSPHNPTGRVWSTEELSKIAWLCEKYDITVFCDEIHQDIVYAGNTHNVIASMSKYMEQHSITFTAPTKTFNLAGLMASAAVIPNVIMANSFNSAIERFDIQINQLGQTAFYTAYEQGEPWLNKLMPYLAQNRELVINTLQDTNISVTRPDGTYLYWLDFSRTGLSHEDISTKLLSLAKTALYDGRLFGIGGDRHFRLNAACAKAFLEQGLQNIVSIFH